MYSDRREDNHSNTQEKVSSVEESARFANIHNFPSTERDLEPSTNKYRNESSSRNYSVNRGEENECNDIDDVFSTGPFFQENSNEKYKAQRAQGNSDPKSDAIFSERIRLIEGKIAKFKTENESDAKKREDDPRIILEANSPRSDFRSKIASIKEDVISSSSNNLRSSNVDPSFTNRFIQDKISPKNQFSKQQQKQPKNQIQNYDNAFQRKQEQPTSYGSEQQNHKKNNFSGHNQKNVHTISFNNLQKPVTFEENQKLSELKIQFYEEKKAFMEQIDQKNRTINELNKQLQLQIQHNRELELENAKFKNDKFQKNTFASSDLRTSGAYNNPNYRLNDANYQPLYKQAFDNSNISVATKDILSSFLQRKEQWEQMKAGQNYQPESVESSFQQEPTANFGETFSTSCAWDRQLQNPKKSKISNHKSRRERSPYTQKRSYSTQGTPQRFLKEKSRRKKKVKAGKKRPKSADRSRSIKKFIKGVAQLLGSEQLMAPCMKKKNQERQENAIKMIQESLKETFNSSSNLGKKKKTKKRPKRSAGFFNQRYAAFD